MSVTEQGRIGEEKSFPLLYKLGFKNVQQLDWVADSPEGKNVAIEVKHKNLWHGNDGFIGTGANLNQIKLRMRLLEKEGIHTYFMNIIPNSSDVYLQYLYNLEKGKYVDVTSDGKVIRIYDINSFSKMSC